MLRLVAGTVLFLLIGLTEALAVEEIKKDTIGPWEIEATFKDNKFDHCAISRKVDEIVASFLRTKPHPSVAKLETGAGKELSRPYEGRRCELEYRRGCRN